MKQGTANLAEDYCFIHKALRPVGTAQRQIAAVPPSNSRPGYTGKSTGIPKYDQPILRVYLYDFDVYIQLGNSDGY